MPIKKALAVAFLGGTSLCWVARDVSPRRLVLDRQLELPSWDAPFGRGENGVDLLALVSEAVSRGAALAFFVALVGLAVGGLLGASLGYRGGKAAQRLAQICDGVQAFPSFVLVLTFLAALKKPGRFHVALLLSLTAWAPFARLALSELRVLRSAGFVEAAEMLGAPRPRILFRHIVPQLSPLLRAQLGVTSSALLVAEAGLSYLGVGPADGVSLGALLDQGIGQSLLAPHVLLVGCLALTLTALSLQWLVE